MRNLVHMLAFALTAEPPPKFEVVNKCPPAFTVVNKTAPAVAVTRPFRGERFNASHQCPQCGRTQYRIAGWVGNGQHRHTCVSCGTSWIH